MTRARQSTDPDNRSQDSRTVDMAEPLSSLVAEAIEAYSRLGNEIARHAQAAVVALDRLGAGGAL